MDRGHLMAAAAVLALAAGAGVWYSRSAPEPPPVSIEMGAGGVESLTVHVSGAVVAPGLIEVPPGARVADAVAAAGGALPGAELSSLNLAAQVGDGQHLLVPQVSDGAPGGRVGDVAGKVRVNTAGVAELEQLPGVGPVLAGRIFQHRETYGPFGVVEDLLDVPGIGEGKLAALRDAVQIP